jgi:hypothetical protein
MQTASKLAASLAGRNGIETLRLYRIVIAAMVTTWKALSKQSLKNLEAVNFQLSPPKSCTCVANVTLQF